ncbi:MAG TPA: hypothetical protein VMD59_24435 [Acidimicrobiales bacterium]|nr:hypothetical protein [Acidimicrobiales bacterium]
MDASTGLGGPTTALLDRGRARSGSSTTNVVVHLPADCVAAGERPQPGDVRRAAPQAEGWSGEHDQWSDPLAPVRVGVVDADPVFATELAGALAEDPVLEVSGTATTVEEGFALAMAGLDLLLVDCRLADSGAARLARTIRLDSLPVAVVGLSSRLDRASRQALVAEGAAGAIDRGMAFEDIAMVVREAFGGRSLRRLAHA